MEALPGTLPAGRNAPQGVVPGRFPRTLPCRRLGRLPKALLGSSTTLPAPRKLAGTMAFMSESRHFQRVTVLAAADPALQAGNADCWAGLNNPDLTRP